ncbi:dephospho-CoA kinase [Rhodobacteraceae bacterium NNCM2]|nr:dephospho-CoA kinase [Coraliihabitans acroporae]
MIVLGLTGSIGMGKSTTAAMFREAGVPVWDADATVHGLYGPGGAGSRAIAELAADAVDENGVDRGKLRAAVLADPGLLERIEAVIHPLVAADRNAFIAAAEADGAAIALCDIPLLYETGADEWLDQVVVVTAPAEVQRARVFERPGMTEEAFQAILAKQTPDAEKRERADFIIDTSKGMDHARARVAEILEALNA